jgi:hypothetical protein
VLPGLGAHGCSPPPKDRSIRRKKDYAKLGSDQEWIAVREQGVEARNRLTPTPGRHEARDDGYALGTSAPPRPGQPGQSPSSGTGRRPVSSGASANRSWAVKGAAKASRERPSSSRRTSRGRSAGVRMSRSLRASRRGALGVRPVFRLGPAALSPRSGLSRALAQSEKPLTRRASSLWTPCCWGVPATPLRPSTRRARGDPPQGPARAGVFLPAAAPRGRVGSGRRGFRPAGLDGEVPPRGRDLRPVRVAVPGEQARAEARHLHIVGRGATGGLFRDVTKMVTRLVAAVAAGRRRLADGARRPSRRS